MLGEVMVLYYVWWFLVAGAYAKVVCTWEQTQVLGEVIVLYYICCFLVAGAYAKVEECRLLELELEREVTLTFPLF